MNKCFYKGDMPSVINIGDGHFQKSNFWLGLNKMDPNSIVRNLVYDVYLVDGKWNYIAIYT